MTDEGLVFKALADPTRRFLLDRLFERDGRTLTELESELEMTRFGVMKHLRVLQDASLVVARKAGREKLHFLNPVPIRLIHDRWIDKYTAGHASALADLKTELENEGMTIARDTSTSGENASEATMEKVYEIYIKTTPERLWKAITDPEMRSKYSFGNRISSDWTTGSRYEATNPGAAGVLVEGENVEVDPPRRLVQTMRALWGDDVKSEGTSRVTWEIEPIGDSCRLTVIHDQLREGANDQLYGGWPMILSGLKTLLETGELLTTPGSLMYANPAPSSGKR
jgi:uncharacterized protein YndB with AHSA1/START domain/DNA-binding transcriptional ArsR family regulator